MRILSDESRLQLLNQNQPGAPWRSCVEKRRCIVCERMFRGSSAIIRRGKNRATRLGCPGCGSSPDQWVRLGNPLMDEDVWADWQRAIEQSAAEQSVEEPLEVAH